MRFEKDWIGNWEEVVWDMDGNWSGLEVNYFRTWKKNVKLEELEVENLEIKDISIGK